MQEPYESAFSNDRSRCGCSSCQPPKFWKIFLKDFFLTTFGVSLFVFLCFAFFGVLAASLSSSVATNLDDKDAFTETVLRGEDDASNLVVVIPIEGEIETEEDGFIAQVVDSIKEEDNVCALVLRINSPGGTIAGSDYYRHLFKKLKTELDIPVVASMGDLTASGGYYIASVADKIYAERSTLTGSIGVIIPMYNGAALCEKIGVKSSAITSGPMKGMGNFMKEPTEEETAIWQSLVDDGYEQFLEVVKEGRPYFQDRDDELRKIADGRIYTAKQALDLHLVDELGFLDDAIDAASDASGVDKNDVQVIRVDEAVGLLDALGLTVKSKNEPLNKAVDAVATPRAYYLMPRALPL